jgi:hypothetical protein
MKYFKTPEFLFEVFGEQQSILEISCTIVFALFGSWIVYSVAGISLDNWKSIIAFLLIADILAGLKNPKNVVIEPDRAMAIKQAIENAAEHDIILIAGKGHETYQLIGEERMHFSDVEQAEKLLER